MNRSKVSTPNTSLIVVRMNFKMLPNNGPHVLSHVHATHFGKENTTHEGCMVST